MQVIHGFSPGRLTQGCVLTMGSFDGVHLGHRALLARLAVQARVRDLPVAVLTFEPHPRAFFTPDRAPVRLSSLREKLEALATLGVDVVQVCRFNQTFAALSAEDFVSRMVLACLNARYVLVGDDFRFGAGRLGNVHTLETVGAGTGMVVEALHTQTLGQERISSSAIRQALQHSDMNHAAALLGRPYSICARVVKGLQLGRKLGFPTLNLGLKGRTPALWGVYVVRVRGLADQPVAGVASIGLRPTLAQGLAPTVEVHLFDWDKACYGAHVCVDFLAHLREEAKYPTLEALTAQIALDAQAARMWHRANPVSDDYLQSLAHY